MGTRIFVRVGVLNKKDVRKSFDKMNEQRRRNKKKR